MPMILADERGRPLRHGDVGRSGSAEQDYLQPERHKRRVMCVRMDDVILSLRASGISFTKRGLPTICE